MSSVLLTPTSYIVLGLIAKDGEATPYELKGRAADTVGEFWSIQHAQVYREPQRLTEAGLLTVEAETTGRRRKTYRLTQSGRDALDAWLTEPTHAFTELRDPGLLQLYFGADPELVAGPQAQAHADKLEEYERLEREMPPTASSGARLVLEAGLRHEREWVRFWTALMPDAPAASDPSRPAAVEPAVSR